MHVMLPIAARFASLLTIQSTFNLLWPSSSVTPVRHGLLCCRHILPKLHPMWLLWLVHALCHDREVWPYATSTVRKQDLNLTREGTACIIELQRVLSRVVPLTPLGIATDGLGNRPLMCNAGRFGTATCCHTKYGDQNFECLWQMCCPCTAPCTKCLIYRELEMRQCVQA